MNPSSVFSSLSVRRNPDAIARRAYEIWNREGRPDGCDLRHWLQAEQELSAEASQEGATALDPQGDVSRNGNGAGTGNGNGGAPQSRSTIVAARPASVSDEVSTPPARASGKVKRSSPADLVGETPARGSSPKRKSSSSGRGSAG
jgi:hypothetical protein